MVTAKGCRLPPPPAAVGRCDLPALPVAEPYIQFVSRVMRVNRQQAPGHPDNRGIVVSHVGLNRDRHWDDFKTLDAEDQLAAQRETTPRPGQRGR